MTDSGSPGHDINVELRASLAPRCSGNTVASDLQGEPLTFDAVYAGYFDFAWRNLRRLGVPAAQLDVAVQDSFIVVHRRLAEFEGRSSLRTWLASICWRVASDYRRTAARQGTLRPLPEDLPASGPDPQQAAVAAESLRRVDELLQQLDDDKRAVFVLTEMEGMSAPEIAAALGVKLNTVYSRLRAARQAFDAALAGQKTGSCR